MWPALRVAAMVVVLVLMVLGCSDPIATAERLLAGGDQAGAEALYKEVLASDPDNLDALSGLAVALALQQKWDEALSVQERVVAADPNDAQTRVELGFNYLNHQQRSDDAVRVFGEAVALEGSAKNLTFLSQAQSATGRVADAEQSLRRALKADPKYPYAYTQLASLLESEGRTEEAQQVVAEASLQGVVVEDSQSQ